VKQFFPHPVAFRTSAHRTFCCGFQQSALVSVSCIGTTRTPPYPRFSSTSGTAQCGSVLF